MRRIFSLVFLLPIFLFAQDFPVIRSANQLHTIFPTTVSSIEVLREKTLSDFSDDLDKIIALPREQKSFENTIKALDIATEKVSVAYHLIGTQAYLSSEEGVQTAARKEIEEISQAMIQVFSDNRALFYAVKDYAEKKEKLTDTEQLYLDETLRGFEEQGHMLPSDERKEVKGLLQEIVKLEEKFEENIQMDQSSIDLEKDQLTGLSEGFIDGLTKLEDNKYRLFCDYPTYFTVMDYCTNADVRKAFYEVFMNRAYPINNETLINMIDKRNALARKLGYSSYAQLSLRKLMALTPQKVDGFLSDLSDQLELKEKSEYAEMQKEPVFEEQINQSGQIYSWNYRFLEKLFVKDYYSVDQQKIAEYFPLPVVINGMTKVFGDFFDLQITVEKPKGLWSEDVISLRIVDNKERQLLGFVVMDLYPRKGKFSHACMMKVLPSKAGDYPSVKMMICNFPKPQEGENKKPSLMPIDQVTTLFHEFGHALHGILGKTVLYGQSGTNVKRDFVELPSQLLEEWAWDKDVLKAISSHYKTKEPLSDEMIDKLIASRYATAGFFYRRQIALSFMSLNYFSGEQIKDPQDMNLEMNKRHRPMIALSDNEHWASCFGHLSGYGACYYGYLWTRVMAADVFSEIKKHKMSKAIGRKYRETILEKGGSVPPQDLVKAFLGREPTQEAFIKSLFQSQRDAYVGNREE